MKQLLFVGMTVLFVGCGGVVNYTEDGGEGAAGGVGGSGPVTTTSPTNTNTNTNTTTTTNSMSVTTGPLTTCDAVCAAFNACESAPNCVDDCAGLYVPGCESEAEALLQCYLSILSSSCDFQPEQCLSQLEAYDSCANSSDCFTTGCDDGPACSCSGECFGGTIDQICQPPQPGPDGGGPPPPAVECECYFDGNFFGTCFQEPFQCSIEEGCCQFLINEPQPG
jgi:hypothetical protein